MKAEYKQYLESWLWEDKKSMIFAKKGKQCEFCKSFKLIEIHHKHYINVGLERMEDVLVLCRSCHDFVHEFLEKNKISVLEAHKSKRITKLIEIKRKLDIEPPK